MSDNLVNRSLSLLNTNDLNNVKSSDIDNIINSVFGADPVPNTTQHHIGCNKCRIVEDHAKGIIVCEDCGQVVDDVYDTIYEYHPHDGNEGDTSRTNIAYNKLLPHSSLGSTVNCNGRMRKLQIWNSVIYKERSLIAIFKQIHTICIHHNISKQIEDDSRIINYYVGKKIHLDGKNRGKPIITRGDNRKGIIGATLLIACTRNGEPRSTKEIALYCGIDEKDINKGLKSLRNILLGDAIIKDTGTSRISDFIQRKCDELQIKNVHANMALTIANNIERLNLASNHTTYSLSAACILLMGELNNVKHITRKKLSEVFDVSDVTIGKTYMQLEKYKTILTNDKLVYALLDKFNAKNKQRKITRCIWVQMEKFGVDTSEYTIDNTELSEASNVILYNARTLNFNNMEKHLSEIEQLFEFIDGAIMNEYNWIIKRFTNNNAHI